MRRSDSTVRRGRSRLIKPSTIWRRRSPAHAKPPFRADHVGSLLRPPELLRARDDAAAGRIGAEELRAAEDEAIRSVVAMQEEVGLQTATDGEFRRTTWHMDFIYQLGGIDPATGEQMRIHFRNEAA